MLVEKCFDTSEVLLNYAEGPDNGPPVWFLHGFLSNWQFFNPIFPQVQSRWHIYATDIRGHGKSGHTPGKYGLGYYYNDLQHFLEEKIADPVIIIGHSKGGVLTSMLASRNPDKVKAAVLLDPPIFISRASKRNMGWWNTFHEITQVKGTVQEKIEFMRNLEVMKRDFMGDIEIDDDSTIKFVDAVGETSVLAWALNNADPNVLEVKMQSLVDPDSAEKYYDWYEPERVLSSIDCPILLIQAGIGVTLPDSDLCEARGWLKDLVHVKLRDHDHGLGIRSWDIGDIMRPISYFLESFR